VTLLRLAEIHQPRPDGPRLATSLLAASAERLVVQIDAVPRAVRDAA
jgi:hypothetical protein